MAAFLDTRFKLPVHIVELVIIVAVLAISGARLTMPGLPRTRANTIALGFSAKSIAFIAYQLLSEHVARFSRWKSLKAYAILNGLEIVFWGAVVFLLIQANIQVCIGTGCILSWVVVGLAISLSTLSTYAFAISFLAFRRSREEQRLGTGFNRETSSQSDMPMEDAQWAASVVHERPRK
ncbi:hypothetical protein N0V93_002036 [Gnomoniopsis smithogilvyi]|uniref:MARVEL domain-containing protein n=1 Tax=Gnomoniopsis smithogilvyi TaxID=1191159 RepID=A0A9W8Z6P2_9PEZI|nr:hypothetical protein N0V93_002036 [Gnomoniopsis smithogilvyi]